MYKYFVANKSRVSEKTRKTEIGELQQKSSDWTVISWKIPEVSSMESMFFKVDKAVQSPPFVFAGTSWILKIYCNGQSEFQSEDYIDIVFERLNCAQNQKFLCKMYCKDVFGKEFNPTKSYLRFHSGQRRDQILKVMHNKLEITPSSKWEIIPDDILTAVCEIQNLTAETELLDQAAGDISTLENTGVPEVGEIRKRSYQLESVTWTIRLAPSLLSNKGLQSPPFSFENSSWILRIFPSFTLTLGSKWTTWSGSIKVALQRLNSQIPEQFVFTNIRLLQDIVNETYDERSDIYYFNENNTLSDAVCFTVQEQKINYKCEYATYTLICEFRTEQKEINELDCQTKLVVAPPRDYPKHKVLQDFKELYLNQTDCDVIIRVKGQEFPAHQAILKARSPVLCSTFQVDMKEKATGVVEIDDCDPSFFADFLCFLYCGEVENISTENVFSLFTTAHKYDVVDLRSYCLQFLKENLTVDIFCDTISLALLYSEDELLKFSTHFFAKNFKKIIVTVKWQMFLAENPTESNELFIKALISNKSSDV